MLTITIPGREESELWDERNCQFINIPPLKPQTIQLEHSLISISKWESKYCKSFIDTPNKTNEELVDYIRMMTITSHVNPELYSCLSEENIKDIVDYMNAPMTATTIRDTNKSKKNSRFVTSELVYCWMVQLNIPFECEKWHINRLITLIRVCNEENKDPKKRKKSEVAKDYAALNAARRKKYNSKG